MILGYLNFITRIYEMKRGILLTFASVIAGSLIATGIISALNTPETHEAPKEVPKTAVVQPAEQPEAVEPVVEPTAPSTPPQSASNEVTTPSNEDLIAQYGWTTGSNRESIDYIMQMYPRYFTDSERVKAFTYLAAVVASNAVVPTEPVQTVDSIDFVKWYFQNTSAHYAWTNVGTLVGVDSSSYHGYYPGYGE
jgi:hypothetical protein